jgi:hypothetical protein
MSHDPSTTREAMAVTLLEDFTGIRVALRPSKQTGDGR